VKTFLFSLLTFVSISVFAKQNPVQTPNCTITKCATANGSQTCDGETTYYAVTKCATVTDYDCAVASSTAMMLATISAQRALQKLFNLLPPCTGPEGPNNP